MARGSSGRIVIEVDPLMKRALYVELARQGLTLKAWFIVEAEHFIAVGDQSTLLAADGSAPPYVACSAVTIKDEP